MDGCVFGAYRGQMQYFTHVLTHSCFTLNGFPQKIIKKYSVKNNWITKILKDEKSNLIHLYKTVRKTKNV